MLNIPNIPNIPIFKGELEVDGLADKVLSSSSIKFNTPILGQSQANQSFLDDFSANKILCATIKRLAFGSEYDKDLYPTKSVLVSTNWNKNDDVFSPVEVWTARHTPSHKRTNIEHDEKQLVGHITNVWAISEDGTIIEDSTAQEDLPDLFHVVNGAVIYAIWQDEDLQKRTDDLIEAIEANEMYVSMECLFRDFDYAVMDESCHGGWKTVARNDKTSWLTKHLRSYGGSGIYNNQRVGRILKHITFCGKGYVKQPANPDSIILSSCAKTFCFSKAARIDDLEEFPDSQTEKKEGDIQNKEDGVLSSSVNSNQGENEIMAVENDKLEAQIKELQEKLEAANKTIADFNESKFTSQIEKLEKEVAELKEVVEAKESELTTKSEELDGVKANLKSLEDVKANLEKEIEKVRAAELKTNRISKLVEGGVDKEKAEAKVELFISLSDEQFDAVAAEIVEAAKAKCKDDEDKEKAESAKDEDKEKDDDEDDADANLNVDVDVDAEPALSSSASQTENKDEEKQKIQQEVASLLAARIKKNKAQKVEE
jgi:hypothetical protein